MQKLPSPTCMKHKLTVQSSVYPSFFLDENSPDLRLQLEEEHQISIALKLEVLLLQDIAVVHHLRALEALVTVDIARLLHPGEDRPRGGTRPDPAQGIATSTPIDLDRTHGLDLRGQDHDHYHRGLGVGRRCEGIEESDGETCRRHRGEGGGGGVLAIQASQATVIEVAVEVEADMQGVGGDACKVYANVMKLFTAKMITPSQRG